VQICLTQGKRNEQTLKSYIIPWSIWSF